MGRPRLFLIDTFGFLFRAYHARARAGAPPMRTSTGLATEAVYIFHNMLRKLRSAYHPEYIAAVLESPGPTFREQEFSGYKANRPEIPPDLSEQIPWTRRLLDALRIPALQFEGYEADDVIGAIARRAGQAGADVVIVSSDKDMMQLVDDHISMLNPAKDDAWYDPAAVQSFLGVAPAQVPDLLALKGDAVDNIPGAPGIGDKGARDLILRFGSVEEALEKAAQVERKAYRESLLANRDQILLSKRLATIDASVPIEWSLDQLTARDPDPGELRQVYLALEFFSLLRELESEQPPLEPAWTAPAGGPGIEELLAGLAEGAPVSVALADELGLATSPGRFQSVPFDALGPVRRLLEDSGRPKVVHDAKSALLELARRGIPAQGFTEDVMLYSFLLSADPAGCAFEALCERLLQRKAPPSAAARAAAVFDLATRLRPQVEERGFGDLYRRIDLPLIPVLAAMEQTGIRIEPGEMKRLSARMDIDILRLTQEVHALAGHPFNLNSPQQLGKVLFEEMNIPVPGRTGKTKAPSTAADVLEALAPAHPIVAKVLEYRQLAKLKGTYVDALPALIDPSTGRLHTSFNPCGAATGRLSSSNPNLQNIPVRTELGRQIRAAFVPREGWLLLSADYSQIELRVLAHLSHDALLVEAFRRGEDIHTRTAAEVFGVPPVLVTPDMRRNAKAVNFGIVYGQTPFGLATQLGIDRRQAEIYIRSYFERYTGVKHFIDATIAEVRKTGVSRTLFGRERPIPDINSSNPNARSFAERTAVNTPVQGAAADLIKLAMIRIQGLLAARGMAARMLLQVHDELLFEAPPEELDQLSSLVKQEMESVHALDVPLLVDIGVGPNWRDAK